MSVVYWVVRYCEGGNAGEAVGLAAFAVGCAEAVVAVTRGKKYQFTVTLIITETLGSVICCTQYQVCDCWFSGFVILPVRFNFHCPKKE